MEVVTMKWVTLFLLASSLVLSACTSNSDTRVVTVADVGGNPDGVTVADSGTIYITDIGSGDIKQVNEDGTSSVVANLGGTHPDGITSVPEGSSEILYVAETGTGTGDGLVVKIDPDTGTVTTFVDSTLLDSPAGIAADESGNLYVADQGSGDVYKIEVDSEGAYVRIESLTDGSGVDVEAPHGLTLVTNEDNSITLYTTDQGSNSNNIVQIDISTIGGVTVTELTPDNAGGTDTGDITNAKFDDPHGISTDKNGAIFVCDENNNRVQIITPNGNVVTLAGNGTSGDADGEAEDAQFNLPRGLATDANGDLLVCDYGNGKVKKIIR